jgi:outer membrane biosynthesis protein TonB
MRRWIAVLWHASFFVIAGALYFFFVLPRWFELTGAWSAGLGLPMRVVCGALIGLAALPVVLAFLKSRRPEFGTPQLALTLRFWSIVLQVLAGALIIGAAVSEIWVSLDAAGPTLFGIYGAAAAIAVLGALSFYLAYAAELPPPPPKPLRPKGQTRRRSRGADIDETDDVDDTEAEVVDETPEATPVDEPVTDAEVEDVPEPATVAESSDTTEVAETPEVSETAEPTEPTEPAKTTEPAETVATAEDTGNADEPTADESDSKLRNRRPSGKSNSRLFGRSRL